MATIDLGKIKLVWRGTYNNGTAYTVDDVVQYTDSGLVSSYICTTNSTGNAPSSSGTAHGSWAYLAKGAAAYTSTLTTQGDILYRDGSGEARLAKGTAGQALKMNSGANAPEWGTISSDFVKLSTVTASTASTVSFDGFFTSDYEWYKVIWKGYSSGDDALNMRMRRSNADVTTSNYEWMAWGGERHSGSSSNDQKAGGWTDSYMRPASFNDLQNGNSNTDYGFNGVSYIYRPLDTSLNNTINGFMSFKSSNAGSMQMYNYMGCLEDAQTAISGISYYPSSGTVTGKWTLYGIKH